MDVQQFWSLIDTARGQLADPADAEAVAARATMLLSALPPEEIIAAQRVLIGLLADSYQPLLWAAGYLVNGGCSDDGFEYFRCWLIAQGQNVFERSLADPDSLADEIIRTVKPGDAVIRECEEMLYIAWQAHIATTGEEIPREAITVRQPDIEFWDFDDEAEMARRLPRLTALCWPST